jgi:cellulose synthase/poly-beta-1,6-N-acetylglucosamine synthase-like glycosyltransferase
VRTLASLAAANGFAKMEVLAVGKISDPEVAEGVRALAARHAQIRHFPVSFARGDSSEKKNTGAREARAAVVAFLDDDVVVAPDWPEKILAPFADPAVGLVSGPSLVPADLRPAARLAGLALASPATGYVAYRYRQRAREPYAVKWSRIIGCNMAYRKSVWEAIGGFDPRFWPGEEMIAAFRAERGGQRIVFHPQAWVEHYPRTSPAGFIRQMFGYGATRIRLIRGGVEVELATLIPGFWLLSLALLIPAAFFWRWAAGLLALNLGLYGLLVLGITAVQAAASRRALDLLLLAYIPLMHLSYGWGEWRELLAPNKDLSETRRR